MCPGCSFFFEERQHGVLGLLNAVLVVNAECERESALGRVDSDDLWIFVELCRDAVEGCVDGSLRELDISLFAGHDFLQIPSDVRVPGT
jgi:hypothetical protein